MHLDWVLSIQQNKMDTFQILKDSQPSTVNKYQKKYYYTNYYSMIIVRKTVGFIAELLCRSGIKMLHEGWGELGMGKKTEKGESRDMQAEKWLSKGPEGNCLKVLVQCFPPVMPWCLSRSQVCLIFICSVLMCYFCALQNYHFLTESWHEKVWEALH